MLRDAGMPALSRTLGTPMLTLFGLGMILGAGIYSVIGTAAAGAGEGLWLSFVIASVVAALTAFSYAELATMYPKAGAEYVYLRAAFPARRWFAAGMGGSSRSQPRARRRPLRSGSRDTSLHWHPYPNRSRPARFSESSSLAMMDSILPRGRARSPIRSAVGRLRSIVGGLRSKQPAADTHAADASAGIDPETLDLRQEIYLRAIARYDHEISTYPGSIVLFRALRPATVGLGAGVDPCFGWRELIRGEIEIIDVPGDHLGSLRAPSVEIVAEAMRQKLAHLGRASSVPTEGSP